MYEIKSPAITCVMLCPGSSSNQRPVIITPLQRATILPDNLGLGPWGGVHQEPYRELNGIYDILFGLGGTTLRLRGPVSQRF